MAVRVFAAAVFLMIACCLVASAAEQIGKDDFASNFPTVEPKKDYYSQGDKVTVTYLIQPKTEDEEARKKLDNRHYIISTELNQPEWKISVVYYDGGIESFSVRDEKEVDVHVKDWEEGLKQISINLTGVIPQISDWYEEVTLLSFQISDADENSIEPVTVKVVDSSKFEAELSDIESEYNELYYQVENATFDISDILDLLKHVKEDLEYAEKYYSEGKFEEAEDSLNSAKENLENARNEFLKASLNHRFEELDKEKKDISAELTLLKYEIDELEKKGLNVVFLKANVSGIEDDLETLDKTLSKVSIYLESENYASAEKNIEIAEEKLNDIKNELDKLKSEVYNLKSEQKGLLDALLQYSEQYLLYITGVLVVVIVAVLVVKFRGRRGKWDELR